jgi:eukaryotic translation initiation factor 2C
LTKCISISGPVVGGSGIFKNSDKFLACSDGTNWDGRPRRSVYGTGGVKVWIRTNHFPMRLPNKTIFVYHVTIRPTCSNRRQKMQLYKLLENNPQYPADCAATDYAETIVSMKQLSSSIIVDDNDGHTFNMLKVREIPLGVLREYLEGRISGYNLAPTFQALQIILAKCLKNNQEVLQTYGKGYFLVGGHSDWVKTVGAGSIAMRGFNFSVRPTVGGLLCGVNVCSTRFYKEGPLTDLIAECLMTNDLGEIQHLSSVQIQKLRRYLRTIMVRIVEAAVQENRKGLVHIIGIDARTPTQVVFEYYDPLQGLAREMNMEEYFSNGIAAKTILSQFINSAWF